MVGEANFINIHILMAVWEPNIYCSRFETQNINLALWKFLILMFMKWTFVEHSSKHEVKQK